MNDTQILNEIHAILKAYAMHGKPLSPAYAERMVDSIDGLRGCERNLENFFGVEVQYAEWRASELREIDRECKPATS
jgi:hypothetical protein